MFVNINDKFTVNMGSVAYIEELSNVMSLYYSAYMYKEEGGLYPIRNCGKIIDQATIRRIHIAARISGFVEAFRNPYRYMINPRAIEFISHENTYYEIMLTNGHNLHVDEIDMDKKLIKNIAGNEYIILAIKVDKNNEEFDRIREEGLLFENIADAISVGRDDIIEVDDANAIKAVIGSIKDK